MRAPRWWRFGTAGPTRVVFHIGLPKCGSTTIQAHFADHDAAYRAQGLVYPVQSRLPGGYRSHLPLLNIPADDLATRIDAIAEEAADARVILLSSEAFGSYLPRGNAAEVGPALAGRFGAENVTVLAYFRNPVGFLASAYAQFVVGGLLDVAKGPFFSQGPLGVAAFVDAATDRKGFAPYDYLGWARAMQAAFPGLRLNLRSMEPSDIRGDLIDDLCRALKVRRAGQDTPSRNLRRDAPSILALQHAQTVFPQPVFNRQREKMRQFQLSTSADWGDADRRHRDLLPDAELVLRMRKCLQDNRPDLKRHFATPIRGLVEMSMPAPLASRHLSDAERREVEQAFAPG